MSEVKITIAIEIDGQIGAKVTVTDSDHPVGDASNRFIREDIRKVADALARMYPDPRSPYSDDLFKVGRSTAQGIVANDRSIHNEQADYDPESGSDWDY